MNLSLNLIRGLCTLILIGLLCGCGQSGPLVHPPKALSSYRGQAAVSRVCTIGLSAWDT